ncbi:pitrilysin family protein [uncultured Brachyspira sp.]|uniref:M16 family metallopeptidase n=1 Tax=uncultured Brachyspira sp. TaxID=221953 RepID=UPI002614BDAC|nr:pitrilysin family protein [uncultured Brachyspira sp.]
MVKRLTLENGIRVVLEKMPILDTVSIGFTFLTGSANEKKDENGYTHFIEHMLFKGTDTMTSKDIIRGIEGVGGIFNAFTSRHLTSFYINIISKYFSRAVDTLENVILNSAFKEDDINREKKVVIEELKMSNDTPEEISANQFFAAAYKGTSMSFPIGGTINNIKNINRDKIYSYFKEHFHSNNLIVSVAGNFDIDYVIERLSKIKLQKKNKTENEELPFYYKTITKEKQELHQVYFSLITPSYSAADNKERYAMNIVNDIFGGSSYSRLFQAIRENKGLCYNIYSYNSSFINGGTFEIHGSTSLDRYEETIESIYYEIEKLISERISEEELEEAKESYKSSMAFSKLNAEFIMNKNTRHELYLSKYVSFKELYSMIDKVNLKIVNEVIDEKLSNKKFFLTAVGAKGTKDISDALSKKLKLN